MDALFCYAGFLWLYRLSFAEVLNEKVQFVKEKSGFPDGLPGREVLRKQISGHVRDGFGTGGHENRNFRQQKGRKQRCNGIGFARLVRRSFRLNKDILEEGKDIIVVARAAAKDKNFDKIESAFLHLCGLHNILKESK